LCLVQDIDGKCFEECQQSRDPLRPVVDDDSQTADEFGMLVSALTAHLDLIQEQLKQLVDFDIEFMSHFVGSAVSENALIQEYREALLNMATAPANVVSFQTKWEQPQIEGFQTQC
jgi:hypothetical protein